MSDQSPPMPPGAVLVRLQVADFDTWRKGFDDNETMRSDAGILGHHINRAEDDPNAVSLYMGLSDVDKAKAFASSDELKQVMQDVGVTGPPEFLWMTPCRQEIVWDRQLPAFVLTHTVADFDKWLDGYDGAQGLRKSAGIIGHAANRSLDDPSLAAVYHQAESFDELRGFLGDPALKAIMDDAGVTSEPEVAFVTGGWAKMY